MIQYNFVADHAYDYIARYYNSKPAREDIKKRILQFRTIKQLCFSIYCGNCYRETGYNMILNKTSQVKLSIMQPFLIGSVYKGHRIISKWGSLRLPFHYNGKHIVYVALFHNTVDRTCKCGYVTMTKNNDSSVLLASNIIFGKLR